MGPHGRSSASDALSTLEQSQDDDLQRRRPSQSQRARPQTSLLPAQHPNLSMSPASRYNHNLKVLRRRDPSIVSIFDQFSHACLYHHNGKKWEKQGFEGTMFLYERDSYPPYGFYILNRMGMEDHIHRLFPEDDIGVHGGYLMLRSYPEFTNRRIARVKASYPQEASNKFSDVWALPRIDHLDKKAKGDSQTVGLWVYDADGREPMKDVILRLHSYIKKNIPYPEEFQYGPDRPPPNKHRPKAASVTQAAGGMSHHTTSSPPATNVESHFAAVELSEIDKLFAKLAPPATAQPPSPVSPTHPQGPTSRMSVETLFAALSGQDMAKPTDERSSPTTAPPIGSTPRAQALLDTIFASARNNSHLGSTNHNLDASAHTFMSASREPVTIHSPTPTVNPLPHVLSQDVLSSLLGLPPSRTGSAASSAYSISGRSHPSSREGDNEDESDTSGIRGFESSDALSESSTVLNMKAETGRPNIMLNGSYGVLAQPLNHSGVHGDVTPRAPMNGFITPPFVRARVQSASHVNGSSTASSSRPINGNVRPLVPFESDSELWPYPPAPVMGSAKKRLDYEGEEIIELDFNDTSALSDPDAFTKAPRKKVGNGKSLREGPSPLVVQDKSKGRKKTKKEKTVEQARIRQEIEGSWDVPEPLFHNQNEKTYRSAELSPRSPSPPQFPLPDRPMNDRHTHSRALAPQQIDHSDKGSQISHIPNGHVSAETIKESVIAGAKDRLSHPGSLDKDKFVKELLTLIHTDTAFVDSLYRGYVDGQR